MDSTWTTNLQEGCSARGSLGIADEAAEGDYFAFFSPAATIERRSMLKPPNASPSALLWLPEGLTEEQYLWNAGYASSSSFPQPDPPSLELFSPSSAKRARCEPEAAANRPPCVRQSSCGASGYFFARKEVAAPEHRGKDRIEHSTSTGGVQHFGSRDSAVHTAAAEGQGRGLTRTRALRSRKDFFQAAGGPSIQQPFEVTGRPTRVEMQGVTELVHKASAGEQAEEDHTDWARGLQEVVPDGEEAVVPVWMANGMRRIPRRIV